MGKNRKKIAFHTLGCKLNFTETSAISRLFPEDEFERVTANTSADIYVINTCSVTDTAEKKCRQVIKKFIHQSPGSIIIVTGCYAQLRPMEISSIPGVDLVLGTNEKFDIRHYLKVSGKKETTEIYSSELPEKNYFFPSYSIGDRTRSFLKIQDGCDNKCAYCTIPLARGNSRNPPIEYLVSKARIIADHGIREIVLTGVNAGDFGKSTGESFTGLLKELVKVEGIERYRISSIEPDLLSEEIIEIVGSHNKILPHFHIPLQSGSDKILCLMRRKYKRNLFETRIKMIRNLMPLAGIGSDVIVGFPGETNSDFEDTYMFLKDIPLSYLHVFTYSERPGTSAEKIQEKVPHTVKERRSTRLITLSGKKHLEFCRLNLGELSDVLFEKSLEKRMIRGLTGNYLRTEHPWLPDLAGRIRKVKLTEITPAGNMKAEIM